MASDNRYPFVTKAEVKRRLENEVAFVIECLALMQARHEMRASGGPTGGPCGWMSSQRSRCTALAMTAAAGEITPKEMAEAARLLMGYSKQIAGVLRERALAADPSLAEAARVFGVLSRAAGSKQQPGAAASALAPSEPAAPKPAAAQPATEEQTDSADDDGERNDDLELSDVALAHLSSAPGSRSEEIAKAIGVTTAMISPVLRQLIAAGRLRSTGVGRGTRYSVA
ncbi:MAG: hypothetical protein HYZ29_08585 [Myxococcales bacterium]|nr:hypothetical protein [Myxococcales bacterium]